MAVWEQELLEIYNYRERNDRKNERTLFWNLALLCPENYRKGEAEREPFIERLVEKALKKAEATETSGFTGE